MTLHFKKRTQSPLGCTDLCTPVMGMSLWGLSPLCETGILKEISIPNEISAWQSTRRRQLRWSDLGSNSKTKLEEIRIIVWLAIGWVYRLASRYSRQPTPIKRPTLRCAVFGNAMHVVRITNDPISVLGGQYDLAYLDSS
ncbi:MAG: hypothetical protein ABL888_16835 [Pirellulaceae bacterium]